MQLDKSFKFSEFYTTRHARLVWLLRLKSIFAFFSINEFTKKKLEHIEDNYSSKRETKEKHITDI